MRYQQSLKLIIMTVFFILLVIISIPMTILFFPVIKELYSSSKKSGLELKDSLNDDPRHFSKQLRQNISSSLTAKTNSSLFEGQVRLPLYIDGDLSAREKTEFTSEVYASGSILLKGSCKIANMASDSSIVLGLSSYVEGSIDAEKSLDVQRGTKINGMASCANDLTIDRDCQFNKLFGLPIKTYHSANTSKIDASVFESTPAISQSTIYISPQLTSIPPNSTIHEDLIVKGPLYIGENTTIKKSIKCYGPLTICEKVTVEGNIFGEKNIIIGSGCVIHGHVFTQKHVTIQSHVKIGSKEKFKSVIGAAGVTIENDVTIFGFIYSSANGKID